MCSVSSHLDLLINSVFVMYPCWFKLYHFCIGSPAVISYCVSLMTARDLVAEFKAEKSSMQNEMKAEQRSMASSGLHDDVEFKTFVNSLEAKPNGSLLLMHCGEA